MGRAVLHKSRKALDIEVINQHNALAMSNLGWVRAKQVSAKRWLYFLTPKGFIEKSRLTLRFLYGTFNSYRDTQKIIVKLLEKSCDNKYFNFIIAGENELAEILCLNIRVSKVITLVGIVANDPESKIMAGKKIQPFSALEELEFDKILVCDLEQEQYIKKYIKDNKLKLSQDKIINLVGLLVNLNQY